MPNAISPNKRSLTFLENRDVYAWMEKVARERKTDVSVILREATSAYYAQHHGHAVSSELDTIRAKSKAAQRAETARQIAAGEVSPSEAQERNAPIFEKVAVVNLWPAIRRHARVRA